MDWVFNHLVPPPTALQIGRMIEAGFAVDFPPRRRPLEGRRKQLSALGPLEAGNPGYPDGLLRTTFQHVGPEIDKLSCEGVWGVGLGSGGGG